MPLKFTRSGSAPREEIRGHCRERKLAENNAQATLRGVESGLKQDIEIGKTMIEALKRKAQRLLGLPMSTHSFVY